VLLCALIKQSCFWTSFERNVRGVCVIFSWFVVLWNLTKLQKDATLSLFVWSTDLCRLFVWSTDLCRYQNKDLIARTNIPVEYLTSCKNLSFNSCRNFQFCFCFAILFCNFSSEKRLTCDTKLIAILRRQFCNILTALEENIFSVASRFRPIRNIFSLN